MSVFEIQSADQFQSIFSSGYGVLIVDHYAEWCGPCKFLAPHFENFAKRFSSSQVLFAKCNADLSIVNVPSLPTIQFFLRGDMVHEIRGADVAEIERAAQACINALQQGTMFTLGQGSSDAPPQKGGLEGARQGMTREVYGKPKPNNLKGNYKRANGT